MTCMATPRPAAASPQGATDMAQNLAQLTDQWMVNPTMFDPTQAIEPVFELQQRGAALAADLQHGRGRPGQRRDRPADRQLPAVAAAEPRRHVDQLDARAARRAAERDQPEPSGPQRAIGKRLCGRWLQQQPLGSGRVFASLLQQGAGANAYGNRSSRRGPGAGGRRPQQLAGGDQRLANPGNPQTMGANVPRSPALNRQGASIRRSSIRRARARA